jgi:Putative zinc-finger
MDHSGIDEELWVDRYLLGRLSAEERQRFEEHLVTCPKCLHALETVEGLRAGLKELPESETTPAPKESVAYRLPPWLLAAAGLVIGFGLAAATFLGEAGRIRRDLANANAASARLKQSETELEKDLQSAKAAAAPSGASVFILDHTRGGPGAEPENRIDLAKSSAWAVLQFDRPSVPEESGYAVRISGADGRTVAGPVKLGSFTGDTLTVTIPGDLIPPGDYTLSVEAVSAPEVSLTAYRFRVANPQ